MDGLTKLVGIGLVVLIGIGILGLIMGAGSIAAAVGAFFSSGTKQIRLLVLAFGLGYGAWSILGSNANKKYDSMTKAILDKNPKRVERILKSGKNPNENDIYYNKYYINTALDVNDVEIVRILLDYGALVDIPCEGYRYPLSVALIKGCDKEITKLLIERGASLNDECEPSFCTPLFFALLFDRMEEAELLFEKGAEVDFRTRFDDSTILMCVLEEGNEKSKWHRDIGFVADKAKWLIAHGADITLTDENGKTALDYLHKFFGSEEQIRAFEESGEIGTYRELEQLLTVPNESGTEAENPKTPSKPEKSGTESARSETETARTEKITELPQAQPQKKVIAKTDFPLGTHTELDDISDDW